MVVMHGSRTTLSLSRESSLTQWLYVKLPLLTKLKIGSLRLAHALYVLTCPW